MKLTINYYSLVSVWAYNNFPLSGHNNLIQYMCTQSFFSCPCLLVMFRIFSLIIVNWSIYMYVTCIFVLCFFVFFMYLYVLLIKRIKKRIIITYQNLVIYCHLSLYADDACLFVFSSSDPNVMSVSVNEDL